MTQISLNASRLLAAAISTTLLMLAPAVRADALQDISKQIKQGQHAQALEQVDKYLAGKPKDAQGRFLKGIVLTEMNKPTEAIAVFSKLTEDYPELPEPYNNLAVIYAQQKQYDKAKQALEMAIRTHPSNSSAQNKLALIRDLMSTASRPGKVSKPVAEPVKLAEAPKVAPGAAPAPPPAAATPAPVAATPAAAAPAKPVEAPRPAPAKAGGEANAEITKAIDLWAAAWSRKDVKAYLAAYARDFKTPAGESRAAWDAERQKRIHKPGAIQVSYEGLRIAVDGETATVKFRQHYKSASLKTSSNKVLLMGKRDGKWQILQERVGS
jgi:Flp pilus assembly protein TadD/ketosteroid isomerase-like protein